MNMSLEQWAKNGWLRPHKSSKQEIADLLRIVDRDLKDAESDISSDWKFGIAYNAALKLCTIPARFNASLARRLACHAVVWRRQVAS